MKLRTAIIAMALGVAPWVGCASDGDGGGESVEGGVDATDDGSAGPDSDDPDSGPGADAAVDAVDDVAEPDAGEPDVGGEGEPDAGPDAGPDGDAGDEGGEPTPSIFDSVKMSPVDEVLEIEGLRGAVHMVRDKDGVPHIFSDNTYDAFFVQGYIHGKDRFAQMLLIRGNVTGTLARLTGSLDADTIGDDIFARVMGFRRIGQATYDALEDGPVKETLDAYVAGINAYLARLREGDESVPAAFGLLVNAKFIQDWTPADVLALAKFQIYNLGFDAFGDINLTKQRAVVAEQFAKDAADPAYAKRAGILNDLARRAPSDPAYQLPGFQGNPWTPPQPASPGVAAAANPWKAPPLPLLDRVQSSLARPISDFAILKGPPTGASNSWVVSGSLTETGNPMLANDPHLSTNSPPLFHGVHIVVEPPAGSPDKRMNIYGLQFPGLPGVLLGHSDTVAWGLTTSGHDYTDAFQETLVWEDDALYPKVQHKGQTVELELVEEVIEIGLSGVVSSTMTIQVPIVPHRGPLAPEIVDNKLLLPEGDTAVSLGWIGFRPTFELSALYGWWTATDVYDVIEATKNWEAASQNLVFVDTSGNIWQGLDGRIPDRPAAAKSYHPEENPDGWAPWWVLDGTGQHDWLPDPISRDLQPNALNPEAGYVVTANNDAVGTTDDNDPLNDYIYIGFDYDIGFRAGRITRRIEEATSGENRMTLEEMGNIQSDYYSEFGARLTPYLLEVGARLVEEYDAPGSHPVLTEVVAAHPGVQTQVESALALLESWNFYAEDGMWGEPTPDQVKASNATSLFNFWAVAAIRGAFLDEWTVVPSIGDQLRARALLWLLENPEQAATFDPDTGESALWDRLDTPGVVERRDAILAGALFVALAELETSFGSADSATWLWGKTHVKKFNTLVPIGAGNEYTWPQPGEGYDNGFPRHGDNYNVDACNGGLSDYSFGCGGVALQRLVAEATPEGIVSFNALPGGQVWDKTSPFFRNQLPTWLDNERRQSTLTPEQLLSDIHEHWVIQPSE